MKWCNIKCLLRRYSGFYLVGDAGKACGSQGRRKQRLEESQLGMELPSSLKSVRPGVTSQGLKREELVNSLPVWIIRWNLEAPRNWIWILQVCRAKVGWFGEHSGLGSIHSGEGYRCPGHRRPVDQGCCWGRTPLPAYVGALWLTPALFLGC